MTADDRDSEDREVEKTPPGQQHLSASKACSKLHPEYIRRLRLARLAAVQALYQAEMNWEAREAVSDQFRSYWVGEELEGIKLDADWSFFDRLLHAVAANRRDIDRAVSAALSRENGFGRLEPVLRAALRLGAAELLYEPDVPPRVAIREYTDLVGDFFDEPQARFATAVLDRIAHSARPGELDDPAADPAA